MGAVKDAFLSEFADPGYPTTEDGIATSMEVVVAASIVSVSSVLPTGAIMPFNLSAATIASDFTGGLGDGGSDYDGWAICDGNNGTPNLSGKFIRHSSTDSGGGGGADAVAHTHSGGAHTHGMNSHTHGGGAHTHGMNSHTHGIGSHAHGMNSHTHPLSNAGGAAIRGTPGAIYYKTTSLGPSFTAGDRQLTTDSSSSTTLSSTPLVGDTDAASGSTAASGGTSDAAAGATASDSATTGAAAGTTDSDSATTGAASDTENRPAYYELVYLMVV